MECYEVKECYSEYLDECLGERHDHVHEHISVCPVCQKELHTMRCIVEAVQCLPEENVSPNFLVSLNERLDSEERGWAGIWESLMVLSKAPNLVAMAATIALVTLISLYISNADIKRGDGLVALEYDPSHVTATVAIPDSRMMEPFLPADLAGLHTRVSSPITPVAFGDFPVPARYSSPMAPMTIMPATASSPFPDMTLLGVVPQPASRQVPYVDKIVLVTTENPTAAGDKIRKMVASLSGLHKDYSENIIFTRLKADKVQPFLQALENMGDIEIVNGPIERGLPIVEIQVIVISDR